MIVEFHVIGWNRLKFATRREPDQKLLVSILVKKKIKRSGNVIPEVVRIRAPLT